MEDDGWLASWPCASAREQGRGRMGGVASRAMTNAVTHNYYYDDDDDDDDDDHFRMSMFVAKCLCSIKMRTYRSRAGRVCESDIYIYI